MECWSTPGAWEGGRGPCAERGLPGLETVGHGLPFSEWGLEQGHEGERRWHLRVKKGLWRGMCPPPASTPARRASSSESACLLGSLANKILTNIPVFPGHLEPQDINFK